MINVINPVNGKIINSYQEHSDKQILEIVAKAESTYNSWKLELVDKRAELLRKAANFLQNHRDKYAQLMAEEMGKPITEGRSEIDKCAWVCNYYAKHAKAQLQPKIVETDASESYISFQPLGAILAVMPWNFPFWQVFRFAAPNLMAGNVVLLKHASNVPGSALAIEKIFLEAGFPEGCFSTLLIGSKKVNKIIENPIVKGVTLTGSTPAGKAVASKAGEMLKKTVMELGGNDPYIVLADADLKQTVQSCAASRLINAGQTCIAAKRFIVVKEVLDEFESLLQKEMQKATMGNPLNEATTIGPLARQDLRAELHQQVAESLKKGASLLLGGTIPGGPGAFYPPTILTNVKPGMPAFDDELFGPVAAIIPTESESEAIKLANNSKFGLGAAVFTKDTARGKQIAENELEAGNCFVNAFVKSDPRLPFGGIKESGYGRELSIFGIREFVNIKTIYIK